MTEKHEKIADQNYQLGVISGFERAAEILKIQSGHAFSNHSDDDANLLRNYADIIYKNAAELRKGYDQKYPKNYDKDK